MNIYANLASNPPKNSSEPDSHAETLRQYISLLTLPVELRIVKSPQGTLSGYFDDPAQLIAECASISGGLGIEAVYTTLNPVKPDLKARANNRIKGWVKHTTAD